MLKRAKRGQSALEFLTTYGWAFLVILVMIGALSYMGILSPQRFLPKQCLFPAPIGTCQDSVISSTGEVKMRITLSGSKAWVLNGYAVSGSATYGAVSCSARDGRSVWYNGGQLIWSPSTSKELILDCSPNGVWKSGQAIRGKVTINYTEIGAQYQKSITGSFSGTCCAN